MSRFLSSCEFGSCFSWVAVWRVTLPLFPFRGGTSASSFLDVRHSECSETTGLFWEPLLMVTCPSFKGKEASARWTMILFQLLSKDAASTRQDTAGAPFLFWGGGGVSGSALGLAGIPERRCGTLFVTLERRYAWTYQLPRQQLWRGKSWLPFESQCRIPDTLLISGLRLNGSLSQDIHLNSYHWSFKIFLKLSQLSGKPLHHPFPAKCFAKMTSRKCKMTLTIWTTVVREVW